MPSAPPPRAPVVATRPVLGGHCDRRTAAARSAPSPPRPRAVSQSVALHCSASESLATTSTLQQPTSRVHFVAPAAIIPYLGLGQTPISFYGRRHSSAALAPRKIAHDSSSASDIAASVHPTPPFFTFPTAFNQQPSLQRRRHEFHFRSTRPFRVVQRSAAPSSSSSSRGSSSHRRAPRLRRVTS